MGSKPLTTERDPAGRSLDRRRPFQPFQSNLLINGRAAAAADNAVFERISPVSGHVASIAAAATPDDARAAALAAAAAFPGWAATSPAFRRDLLQKGAQILRDKREEAAARMMAETGATRQWCDGNVDFGADILLDAAAMTTMITGSVLPTDKADMTAFGLRQPVGVCLAMAPWNAPLLLGIRSIAMALACGNTVILKSSELCPASHRLIGDIMTEAGFPAGVVNVVSNAPADASAIVEALIGHPVIRRINFTGSTRVGRTIALMAAKHLKRSLLELGGKAPFIVLDDADLDEAVRAAAFGAFYNQGQICMSTERIIVLDSIADAFVELFTAKAKTLKAGDPGRGHMPLGALITSDSARRVRAMIDDALSKGAELRTGGDVRDAFMDATVIDRVTRPMRLYHEESFGPVASIIRVEDVEEAISVANDCDYGLSGAVFGRDIGRALQVAQRIESGICHINSATVEDEPHMPFGGVKASGYGRFGGQAALDEFTELRWVTIAEGPRHYPI
jgi:acyl-CoA reductase-like NAD-dependent aldehyde dehydrogenase